MILVGICCFLMGGTLHERCGIKRSGHSEVYCRVYGLQEGNKEDDLPGPPTSLNYALRRSHLSTFGLCEGYLWLSQISGYLLGVPIMRMMVFMWSIFGPLYSGKLPVGDSA